MEWMHPALFNHSPIKGHLGYFQFGAVSIRGCSEDSCTCFCTKTKQVSKTAIIGLYNKYISSFLKKLPKLQAKKNTGKEDWWGARGLLQELKYAQRRRSSSISG